MLGTLFQVKGKAKFFIVKHGLELLQGNNVCGKYYIFDMQKNNNWLALLINCTIFPTFYGVSVTINFVTQIEGDQSQLFIPY